MNVSKSKGEGKTMSKRYEILYGMDGEFWGVENTFSKAYETAKNLPFSHVEIWELDEYSGDCKRVY